MASRHASDQKVRWATIDVASRKDSAFQKTGRMPHIEKAASAAAMPFCCGLMVMSMGEIAAR